MPVIHMATPDSDDRDRADMQRLAAGEDAALDALMQRHAAAVHRLLLGLLGDPQDALDLTQETFVRVYQARHRFRPRERFIPWLFTIATNLARNRIRWRQRHPMVPWEPNPTGPRNAGAGATPSVDCPEVADSPAEILLSRERIDAVRQAVARLPPELREALVLCEWEELSQAEAAAVLGTTVKAVESRLYRARQILRAELRPWL